MEEEIKRLQVEINPLFENRNVYFDSSKSTKQSIKKTHKFNLLDVKQEHLFNINPNSLNESQQSEYLKFLTFIKTNVSRHNEEYDVNKGNIISSYVYNSDYTDLIEKLKTDYESIYLSRISKFTYPKNIYRQTYPDFNDDLMAKSRKILYEINEKQYGIKNIMDQNDNEFMATIKKRLEGLKKCADSAALKEKKEKKEYYNYEEESFKKTLDNLDANPVLDDKTKIKEICKNIKWGVKDYEYHRDNKFNLEQFKLFLGNNPDEVHNLRTFLPDNCFNEDGSLNFDVINELAQKHDRNHKQYIFGYSEDIAKYAEFKQFYELFNMDFSEDSDSCDMLVMWNMISNLFFNRCAISNDDIPFPVRFVIPHKDFNQISGKQLEYQFNLRKTGLINPFTTEDLQFIGFISIKYYYKPLGQFRTWFYFYFQIVILIMSNT